MVALADVAAAPAVSAAVVASPAIGVLHHLQSMLLLNNAVHVDHLLLFLCPKQLFTTSQQVSIALLPNSFLS